VDSTNISVEFELGPSGLNSRVDWLEISASANEKVTRMDREVRDFTIGSLEPGTHVLGVAAVGGAGASGQMQATLGSTEVMWDAIMSPQAMRSHRVSPSAELGGLVTHIGAASSPPSRRIKVCFITVFKLDGQRTIYLRQMESLPRDRFEVVVLNTAHKPPTSGEEGIQDQSSIFVQHAQRLGVSVYVAEPPIVTHEEIEVGAVILMKTRRRGAVLSKLNLMLLLGCAWAWSRD
jgi:hypothetical protein